MKNLNENLKDASIQSLELKANLNPEQREYLDVLKDKMKKILGNKTKQELAKAGDLTSLKNYKEVLVEILDFLRTKKIKNIKSKEHHDPETIKKQLETINMEISIIIHDHSGEPLSEIKLKALKSQYDTVSLSTKIKTKVKKDPRTEFLVTLNEDEVWNKIQSLAGWPDNYTFLISKTVNEQGVLLSMSVGILRHPQVAYRYDLEGGNLMTTLIQKMEIDLNSLKPISKKILSYYKEQDQKWRDFS